MKNKKKEKAKNNTKELPNNRKIKKSKIILNTIVKKVKKIRKKNKKKRKNKKQLLLNHNNLKKSNYLEFLKAKNIKNKRKSNKNKIKNKSIKRKAKFNQNYKLKKNQSNKT